MKDYLLEKKEDIASLDVREREIEFLDTKVAQTVIGPRRAGKSFSLFYWIKAKKIKDEDYLFVNFEDDEIKEMKREEKTRGIEKHIEIYGKEPKYLFFDEIQNLEKWQSFIYSLVEKKRYNIFLTGSTSKISSREIATQLRGRALTKVVLPLNFREFSKLGGIKRKQFFSRRERAKTENLLSTYLTSSGFPQIVIDKLPPKSFINEYIEMVIFKDMVERYRIENIQAARFLIRRAISNFSCRFSLNKLYNDLKSLGEKVGKGTLYSYLSYLEEIMTIFTLRKFSFSERESELSVPKVYLCDQGLANYGMKTKYSGNFGKLMENVVFLELKKKSLEKDMELFYFVDYQGKEVDFVVKEGLKVKQLIQVTYASARDEIERREIKALLKASELLKCKDLLCITWDYEDEEEIENRKIKFVPLWKWLLG